MSAELCHAGLLELGCLIDLSWIQTSAWLATAIPAGQTPRASPNGGFADAVLEAADLLPADQAHALWLVDVCGCSYAQGAAETETTPGKFGRRVRSARNKIHRAVT